MCSMYIVCTHALLVEAAPWCSNRVHVLWVAVRRARGLISYLTIYYIQSNLQPSEIRDGFTRSKIGHCSRFPCGVLTSFYRDVTNAPLSDGPFDCDIIMKMSANRWDVGPLAIRQLEW